MPVDPPSPVDPATASSPGSVPGPAQVLSQYPAVAALPAALRDEVLATQAQWLQVPAGTRLFDEGAPCRGFPLVVAGAIRVARGHDSGRSIELYRVQPGELCVVSTACLFGGQPLSAHGDTVAPTTFVLLARAGFERWVAHDAFRRYVFGVFGDRLADLMALAEAVAFQRMDQRLAAALLGHGVQRRVTHQALADELGTAREVVSRLLRRFEQEGWVALGRERIELRDAPALRALAGGLGGIGGAPGRPAAASGPADGAAPPGDVPSAWPPV